MFVVEIIPLKKGTTVDTLTYFSSTEYPLGTILEIPIRSGVARGIVTRTESVSATRAALKAATFSLRKLSVQEAISSLSPAYLKTAEELANYYIASTGSIIYNLLSPEVRSGEIPLPHTHHVQHPEILPPETLQANKDERYLTYRSLAREIFAHGGSIVCVVPTSGDADMLYASLSQGIEDRIIMLTSTMGKKQLRDAYAKLEDFSKSKLIIATPSHAVLERHDITTIVMERARSPFYKERVRPYLDYRDVLRVHAKHTGRRLVYGDMVLRTEEEWMRREERYPALGNVPKRIDLLGSLSVVQMKNEPDGKTPFSLFSEEVKKAILENKKKRGHMFLFAARRGLAPVVACIDCGYIFRSPESGAPYSLIRIKKGEVEERWFVCSTSGHRVRAADTCASCGSWRLRERGIGIQHVYDELQKIIKDNIILFDHTTASTYKKACFLRDRFLNTKGSIMLGTHMALSYITRTVDTSVVVNMDALYATPTWRLQEENFAFLMELRELTEGTVYIQARTEDDTLLRHARHGTVEQFYSEELQLRESFKYPPFSTFIHLTWQGSPSAVKALEQTIQEKLGAYELACYSAPPGLKDVVTAHGLIRLAAQKWPDPALHSVLRSLPPSVRIVINPDRIV